MKLLSAKGRGEAADVIRKDLPLLPFGNVEVVRRLFAAREHHSLVSGDYDTPGVTMTHQD